MQSAHAQLAQQIADLFASSDQVESVALGGSRASGLGTCDSMSDIDVYVYTRAAIPLDVRRRIVNASGGATRADLDLGYWAAGDAWVSAPTGVEIDVMYFDALWTEDQITRLLERHQASLGYSTCFWHTVRRSRVLYDRHAWLVDLQQRCQADYPEPLRQNIISLNHPVLRGIIPSYASQIEKAVRRFDLVSVNHRLGALLSSYFDIIFALNRVLHPGEKRMVEFAVANCTMLPVSMQNDITAMLLTSTTDIPDLPARVARLLDRLDHALDEGFGPLG